MAGVRRGRKGERRAREGREDRTREGRGRGRRTFSLPISRLNNFDDITTACRAGYCALTDNFMDSYLFQLIAVYNLVPRSLVDEAEGEIWPNPICITLCNVPVRNSHTKSTGVFVGKFEKNHSSRPLLGGG